jgi:hypothetical protein
MIKLNVDEIKLDTIRYQKLASDDPADLDSSCEDLSNAITREDFSWFRRSLHFLLFVIIIAILFLVMLILPRHAPLVESMNVKQTGGGSDLPQEKEDFIRTSWGFTENFLRAVEGDGRKREKTERPGKEEKER